MPHDPRPKMFEYRHFEPQIILLCLGRYLRYSLSYRDLEEMMVERGLSADHTTIYRSIVGFNVMRLRADFGEEMPRKA